MWRMFALNLPNLVKIVTFKVFSLMMNNNPIFAEKFGKCKFSVLLLFLGVFLIF